MILLVLLPFVINNIIFSQIDFDEYLSLDIESESVDLGIISPLDSPVEIPGVVKVTIKASDDWVLLCSADRDFLSREGDMIPIERLAWRIKGEEWVAFEMGEMKLLEGIPTEETGESFTIDLRLDLKWKDNAGDFLANIDFTLMKK
jgi:hypothetical protein